MPALTPMLNKLGSPASAVGTKGITTPGVGTALVFESLVTTAAPTLATQGKAIDEQPYAYLDLYSSVGADFHCKLWLYSSTSGKWAQSTSFGEVTVATAAGVQRVKVETLNASRIYVEINAVNGGGEKASIWCDYAGY